MVCENGGFTDRFTDHGLENIVKYNHNFPICPLISIVILFLKCISNTAN